ncbi:hypothetical protein L596_008783 [Steinernema carpocapsae]|uniref:Phosphoribosyltransferase domain-containing protein n=1 Tax=Steinernema carpocapsae TaxID=34508 RepID=A0A4U5PDM5_STECR|nr:hypothetical protein L596_008783 [Steinernema carpocapsae]
MVSINEGSSVYENVIVLPSSDHMKELHTVLRDKTTDRSDFVFCADRLMRLIIEEGLNRLPYTPVQITTPTGCEYDGIAFARGNCGVSICRSGEVMEQALRQCCRSIRIGKVLVGDEDRVLYSKLITDINRRRVLLLYPLLTTGQTIIKAMKVLLDNGVHEENIILLSVFSTPNSIRFIRKHFEKMTIITSEVNSSIPAYFATKYFGTD